MEDETAALNAIAAMFPGYPLYVQHDTQGRRVVEKGKGTLSHRHPWPSCDHDIPVVLRAVLPNEVYFEADGATFEEQAEALRRIAGVVGPEYLLVAWSGTKSLHASFFFDPATLPGGAEGVDLLLVARMTLLREIPRRANVAVTYDVSNVNWHVTTMGHPVRWAGTTNMKPGAEPFTYIDGVPDRKPTKYEWRLPTGIPKPWAIPPDLQTAILDEARKEQARIAERESRRAVITDERIARFVETYGKEGWRRLVPEWSPWFMEGSIWEPGQRNPRATMCIRAMGTLGMSHDEIRVELEKLRVHVNDDGYDFEASWFSHIDDKMLLPIEVSERVFEDMELDARVDKTVGRLKERVAAAPMAMAEAPEPEEAVIVENEADYGAVPWSDIANAQRFAKYGAGEFLFQWFGEKGRWLKWDGGRWNAEIGEQMARKAAHLVAISIYHSIPDLDTKAARKKMADWAERSQSRQRLDAMLVESRPYLGARSEQFDADPMLLNVQNGVVDLTTGELRPHDPGMMMTRISNATFDPKAKAPRFMAFLERVLPDPELRRHLQMWAGYSLTGITTERKFRIDIGDRARNGKSTLYNVLLALLGDYGTVTLFDTFGTGRRSDEDGERPKNGLAALVGRRLVVAIESSQNFKMNVNLVKSITGSDKITCRFLFKEFFTYVPQFKVWLASNNPPKIQDDGNAIWDRMQRVDWNIRIGEEEEIKGLSDIIVSEELPGILNWAIEGCLEWQRLQNLPAPAAVEKATRDYREEEFVLSEFISDMCERVPGENTRLDVLYNHYKVWYVATGQSDAKMLNKYGFGRILTQRFTPKKVQGERVYAGIRLKKA